MATTSYRDAPLISPPRVPGWDAGPWRHLVPAVLLPLVEALYVQTAVEWLVAVLVLGAVAVLVLWALPQQDALLIHGQPSVARRLGRASLIWLASVVATVATGFLFRAASARYDARAAATVSGAVERYRTDHGEYPPSLRALVPRYLAEVPTAHLQSGEECSFRYRGLGAKAELGRLDLVADVGCRVNDGDVYDFVRHRWSRCGGTSCVYGTGSPSAP